MKAKFNWSWLLFCLPFGMLIFIGCVEPSRQSSVTTQNFYVPESSDKQGSISITSLGNGWKIIELVYKNKTHVFLQNYDGNNQSLVKFQEFVTEQ